MHADRSRSPAALALGLGSLLYGLGLRLDRARYRRRGRRRLPGLVVSVGGLTAGGAGKTPMTAVLAEWARGQGHRVAVLSRGYGGKRGRGVVTVSDGERVLAGADQAGDEPRMLAERLCGVPVVVAGRRFRAGRLAHETWGTRVFLLDDGFQHWALERDVDVVLLDAQNPVGNGHLLPWGPLREPVEALGRAQVAVLTRCRVLESGGEPADRLLSRFPGLPVVRSVHAPAGVRFSGRNRQREEPPSSLRGRRVAAFCGIARPAAFRETLADLGAEVVVFQAFRDHHPYTRREVDRLLARFRRCGAEALLTTEKDWMRAGRLLSGVQEAGFLRIALAFPNGSRALFDAVSAAAARRGL